MSITTVVQKAFQYPWNPVNAKLIKAWVDAMTTAANSASGVANALSADEVGRAVMQNGFFNEATATAKFAAGAIVGTLLKAGALAATTAGRALMATGYFDEATATDKFAAQAITGGLLKNAAVDSAQIKAGAVTGPKLAAAGVLNIAVITGADAGSAPVSTVLANAAIGDVVLAVVDLSTPAKDTTHFEAAITVAGHIQQTSGTLTEKYLVILQKQS